jgi:hypothetical protein
VTVAFEVLDSRPEPYAASPTLALRLRITEADGRAVHAMALRCQIRIEPQSRTYDDKEGDRLYELFGARPQWSQSLHPFRWVEVATTVTAFRASTEIDLMIPCTYDFEVSAAKYLHALDDGEVPLALLFAGTVFPKAESGFAAEPVSWGADTSYRMPVRVWRDTMDLYFPNSGWLRLDRDTIDALTRFKAQHALPTWEQTIERLLKEAGGEL